MKYETKLALQIFGLGILFILTVFIIFYRYHSKSNIQIELQHSTSFANEESLNFEQVLLEKIKTNKTFSVAPIFKNALKKSNNKYGQLSEKERNDKIFRQNEKWKSIEDENDVFIREYTHNSVAHFLKAQQNNLPGEYGEIFLTNKYGVIIASTSKLTTLSHAHKYWWQGAYQNGVGAIFFDDRGYDDSVDGYVLGIVIPIKEDNRIIGILKVNLNILGAISEMILNTQNENIGDFKIVRSGGEIIFDNRSVPLSSRIPDLLYEKIKLGDKRPLVLEDSTGKCLVGMAEIQITSNNNSRYIFGGSFESIDHKKGNKGESWYIINYRNIDTVLEPIQKVSFNILVIGFILVIILAFAAFILGKLSVQPLKQLIVQSKEIAKANFTTRVVIKRKNEIGVLGTAFNKMAEELEKNTTSIKNLESEIEHRIIAEQALKASEGSFRIIFENSPLGIYLAKPDGSIINGNNALLNILGSPSIEATKQINVLEFKPLVENGYAEDFLKCVNTGEIVTIEILYKSKWGKEIFLSSYIVPLKDDNEKVVKVFTVMEDITDRTKALNALKESESKLLESNKTKDKFFSIISHDLKSPFLSMLGFSELLMKNFDKYDIASKKKFISTIYESIHKTYKLLENLLLWSRSQRGVMIFNPENENLYLLCNETIELSSQVAANKSISLKNEVSENLYVKADKNMLLTILRNLISNAIKFTDKKGEIILDAKKRIGENKQEYVEISVSDNGVGITSELQSKLFKITENVSTIGTNKEHGTGLGLILCKEFVEKHGGKIWVESEVGGLPSSKAGGSKFIFTIPIAS